MVFVGLSFLFFILFLQDIYNLFIQRIISKLDKSIKNMSKVGLSGF